MENYSEFESKLKLRTRAYALAIVRLVQSVKHEMVSDVLAKQLVRCGTSVGANYRSACRARSRAEMISRLSVVEEEADESLYWLEIMADAQILERSAIQNLMLEGEEILKIVVASIRTLKSKQDTIREDLAVYNLLTPNSKSSIPN